MPSRRQVLAGVFGLAAGVAWFDRIAAVAGTDLPERELPAGEAREPYFPERNFDLHPVAAFELGDADHGSHHLVVVNLTGSAVEVELTLRSGLLDRVVYGRALRIDAGGYASWRFTRSAEYGVTLVAAGDRLNATVDAGRIDCNESHRTFLVDDRVTTGPAMSTDMGCGPF